METACGGNAYFMLEFHSDMTKFNRFFPLNLQKNTKVFVKIAYIYQMLTYLNIFITDALDSNKFAIVPLLKIPLHLKHVATQAYLVKYSRRLSNRLLYRKGTTVV